jgi:putative acetyltransferase
MNSLHIRPIVAGDDPVVAAIIRSVMPEFGACGAGFAINDPEVDGMTAAYAIPRAAYFVVVSGDRVVGCGGVAPLIGGAADECELRKMYFLKEARGTGMGERLLRHCLEVARAFQFNTCYLETLASMHAAHRLYEKLGFQRIEGPRGATGHFSCDRFYELRLR